jgi:hypothetical protein
MKRDAAEILRDALALPTEARAALAGSLLDTVLVIEGFRFFFFSNEGGDLFARAWDEYFHRS